MKHILLILSGLSIASCLMAQDLMPELLKQHSPWARLKSDVRLSCASERYSWNEDNSSWDLAAKAVYLNEEGKIILSDSYLVDQDVVTPTTRYQYVYSSGDGQVDVFTVQNWNKTAWVNASRIKYTYDSEGRRTSEINQDWDAVKNDWVDASRSMTTLNQDGRDIIVFQTWNGANWIDTERSLSGVDDNGTLVSITQKWDDEAVAWINEYGYNFIFDDVENLLELSQLVWNSNLESWSEPARTFFTYDDKNHEVLRVDQRRSTSNDDWEDYEKDTLIYDGDKLIAEVRTALNFSSTWEPLSNTIYTREGNTDVQTVQYWNGDWINNSKYVTFYDCPITGVADEHKASTHIFPNPSNGVFNFNDLASGSTIVIYDLKGRQINKTVTKGESSVVNLEGNTEGTYYYLINKGGNSISGKLILK